MRRLEWAGEFSKFCEQQGWGQQTGRFRSELRDDGAPGFCARTICGAGICPADGTLATRKDSKATQ